ncbi:MAG TPA: chloride channel protein [Candidatus Angelobacter sp.]|nr:chloride channel protein [Candidatus Angelobacter sp.]
MKEPTQARPVVSTHSSASAETLGDFTTTWRVLPITLLAIVIGVVSAYVAVVLLKLIAFFTNLFFFHRWSMAPASPGDAHLGLWVILVPVVGGLIVGLMAKFGSDKIRGHGIPEAIEAILLRGAKVEPRLAVLKPVSTAISIGSGGPFGAEGPIIMTGGAFGSLIAQFFHLTSAERKTLLVAGAAAGMSATFAAPFASILLAIELLLFEWKPRSFIPVALASITASAARVHLLGVGPIFPTPAHDVVWAPAILFGCLLAGFLSGCLAALVTQMVYAFEDAFSHLKRVHWMWWPAIGGLGIGIGGYFYPRALGVGYDVIQQLLQGNATVKMILGVLIVKSLIWSFSLGSGTSGGVLAPLLMMGSALGAVDAMFLPHQGAGFWPLISMGAMLAGTMRAPLTGVIFAFELTGNYHSILPLLIACVTAHSFTVLTMARSILTEKISRRGHHLSCEYVVDPLEALAVGDVMRTKITVFPAEATIAELQAALERNMDSRGQRVYPVVGENKRLLGVMTRHDIMKILQEVRDGNELHVRLSDMIAQSPVVAYPDEPLRLVVNRMASTGLTRFPVVDQDDGQELLGMIALPDLLKAREHSVQEEHLRERVLHLRVPPSLRWRSFGGTGKTANHAKSPEPATVDEVGTPEPTSVHETETKES